jgi:FlaG/FlaF family flagellin (archaellin)
MKKSTLLANDYAVSEVIGATLLVLIAVVAAASIYNQMLPVPIPSPEPNVQLMGYVTENGDVIIEHMGGEILDSYEVYIDGESVYTNPDGEYLDIGSTIPSSIIPTLLDENDQVRITVYAINDDGSNVVVFDGIIFGLEEQEASPLPPLFHPMLISSLRTDTTDEDLICFNYNMTPEIDALTYIYKWIVNDESFAELLLPFDTESDTIVKDYSDNDNNGTISSAVWTNEGVVGGAYYFSGGSDYIEFDLPTPFNDIANTDFTISLWLKSDDITDDWRSLLEARYDTKNFVRIFQCGTEIHFGVSDDGIKRAVRTENLSSNTWYHITGVWDASEKLLEIYTNGEVSEETGDRNYANGAQTGLHLGHGTASSRFWLGYIDDFQLYGRTLSSSQINQIYLGSKDGFSDARVIVSEETVLGDVWQVVVTPNDGTQDDNAVTSNTLQIVSYGGGG